MKNILFVCLGNICRSPAAEAIFAQKILNDHEGLVAKIESAGTIGHHQGEPCDPRMEKALNGRGYESQSLSRRVKDQDFFDFDLILAMDQQNYEDLMSRRPDDARASVELMCEFCSERPDREVPDPYYGGAKGFDLVIDILEDATEGLIRKLQS